MTLAAIGFGAFLALFLGALILFAIFAAFGGMIFDKRPDSEQKQERIGVGGQR